MDGKRQVIIKLLLIAIFSLLFIGTLERFNIISFANHNLPEAIGLNKIEVGVKENDTISLVATIYPINSFEGKIEWSSSDKSIAEVNDDGNVYGRSIGTATITASIPYNKMSVSCIVHVLSTDLPIESFKLTTNEITLELEESYDINYQVYPVESNNKNIYYASSDENVVTVDNLGHVNTVSIGTAYIRAYSLNGTTELLKVNVVKKLNNKKLEVSNNNINLNVGAKIKINANNDNVYWESLNPSIVRVDKGVIEALNVGDAKVLAKVSPDNVEVIDVQVTNHKINVNKIQIKEKNVELYLDDTYDINVGILPLNATNKNLVYTSLDPTVVTIDEGTIKGVGLGEAEIEIRDKNSNASDRMKVTVYDNPNNVYLDDLEFYDDEITVFVGSSMPLNYKVDPVNANQNLVWTSSNQEVVLVDNGTIRAVAEGEATIYVTKGDVSKKIDVIVVPIPLLSINTNDKYITLSPGETHIINIGFVPNNATDINLEFTSLNPNIATVENGIIKGVDIGNTIIEIRSNNIDLDINVEVR